MRKIAFLAVDKFNAGINPESLRRNRKVIFTYGIQQNGVGLSVQF